MHKGSVTPMLRNVCPQMRQRQLTRLYLGGGLLLFLGGWAVLIWGVAAHDELTWIGLGLVCTTSVFARHQNADRVINRLTQIFGAMVGDVSIPLPAPRVEEMPESAVPIEPPTESV